MAKIHFEPIKPPTGKKPISFEPIDPPAKEEEKGLLQKWDEAWFNKPLLPQISEGAKYFANKIDEDTMSRAARGEPNDIGLNNPYMRGFASGALQGIGDVASSFTSPLNLATLGVAGRANMALKGASALTKAGKTAQAAKKLTTAARATKAERVLSAPVIGSGVARVERGIAGGEDREGPVDWGDVGFGAVEMAGGAAGTMQPSPRLTQIADASSGPINPVREQTQRTFFDQEPGPEGWTKPQMDEGLRQPDLPYDPIYRQPGDREVKWMDEPYLPYKEEGPVQGELPLGGDDLFGDPLHRGPLPVKDPVAPNIDEMSPKDAFNTLSPDQPVVSPVDGPETWPRMVEKDNWTPADVALWKSRGYVSIGVGPSGKARMIPGVTPPVASTPAPPAPKTGMRSAIPEGHVPHVEGADEAYDVNVLSDELLNNTKSRGLVLKGIENGKAIFTRLLKDTSGTFDPAEMWKNLKQLLGRDPTPEEVEQGMNRQVRPGEPTGRMAPFTKPFPSFEEQAANQIPWDGPDPTIGSTTWDQPYGTRPEDAQQSPYGEDYGEFPDGSLDDPIMSFPNGPQQQGLPTPMEAALPEPSGDIAALRAQQLLGENWGETRQPEQLSMEGQMKDAELTDFLRNEDATPPEMIDLPLYNPRDMEPQEMRVPGHREGNTGLENVAMGGASPRVLDVMGSSLYSRPGPVVTMKELLQNAFDEHKELGIAEPVRVIVDKMATNPRTQATSKAITIRDRGRGLNPEQIYSVFTNLGETGKAGVESAAGGFGFAKAAPFLGGEYVQIRSVTDTPEGRVEYTFEGNPSELKNQARGVPLNARSVGPEVPTGLQVTTHYSNESSGFYDAARWAENMTERSPSVQSGIMLVDTYGASPKEARRWLDETPENPITEYNSLRDLSESFQSKSVEPLMDTIETPGAKVNIHYNIPPGTEASNYNLHFTNKGMYQGSDQGSYGGVTSNVPKSIVADIIATVEEGHEHYPFSANREQLNSKVTSAIDKWIQENIVTGVMKKRVMEVQRTYDNIQPLDADAYHTMHIYDEGNRLTPDELNMIKNHPELNEALTVLESVHLKMLKLVDSLNWSPEVYTGTWKKTSDRLKKFGLLVKGPDDRGTTLGIHVPRPDDVNNSAILINLFEHLNLAMADPNPIDQLTTALFTTLAHEQAHIPGGSHDKGHSYRDADLRGKLGEINTIEWLDELGKAFDDGQGGINPKISEILSVYNESRTRAASEKDALLATGIDSQRRPDSSGGTEGNTEGSLGSRIKSEASRFLTDQSGEFDPVGMWKNVKGKTGWGQGGSKYSTGESTELPPNQVREVLNIPTNLTTTGDLSAPGRQGLTQIFTPEFWQALGPMVKAGWSQEFTNKMDAELRSKPIMQQTRDPRTGKVNKSFGQQIGMEMMDVGHKPTPREEATAAKWVEKIPIAGRYFKGSNRAFATFMNHLRVNRTEKLLNNARDMAIKASETGEARPGFLKQKYTPEEAVNLNPYENLVLAKEIAEFVNTATGRGPLKTHILPHRSTEISLEAAADKLGYALFSPRLLASRVRMMNPSTYIMASPYVRKQYLKAALSTAAAWYAFSELGKMAGAEVNDDITSSDFGKIRIGDTRLDLGGGFLQFAVAYGRAWKGGYTSSATGEYRRFGSGFQATTQLDSGERFLANKLNPVAKFAYDVANASEYQPFHVGDRALQMFIPLIGQDLYELSQENPDLIPLGLLAALGGGTQTYSAGESVGKFIPPEKDWLVTGGGASDLMPWNLGD